MSSTPSCRLDNNILARSRCTAGSWPQPRPWEPFAGWPLSWVSEIAERAIAQLQDAAAAAAAGHRRRREYEAAEHAIRTGLKLCDPNETLYLEWARLEAARGRHDQIGRIRRRLQAAYDAHADENAGFVGTITTATATAFQELQAGAST